MFNVKPEELIPNEHGKRKIRMKPSWLTIAVTLVYGIFLSLLFYTGDVKPVPTLIGFFTTIGLLLSLCLLIIDSYSESDKELGQILYERKAINNKIDQKPEPDIYDTIRLSLNKINEYYTINQSQAKSSFASSMLAIFSGLITLLSGVWLYYYGQYPSINITVLTSVSGVLLEFIGGAYFFVYKKSLEQVNFFFGQLIKVQDTMLAINLSKGMDDRTKAGEMTEKIITSLLERSLK